MEYNFLGKTNLQVSKICLGTMHFGKLTDEKEAFCIMDKALDLGINFFDTANIYGRPRGESEIIIGNWFQKHKKRNKVVLATKGYQGMDVDKGTMYPNEGHLTSALKVRRDIEGSMKRLQTDHIELYQTHHIDRRVSVEEFWNAFDKIIEKDYATYIGTSNFPGWALTKFQAAAKQRGKIGIASEQHMYNLLCRYPELEVLPAALDNGIGVLPYMPLSGGLLTGKTITSAGERTNEVAVEYGIDYEKNERIIAFNKLCAEMGEKPATVATAWVLANPAVSSVIIGVRTLKHLDEVERMSTLKLDESMIKTLNDMFPISEGRKLKNNLPIPECYAW